MDAGGESRDTRTYAVIGAAMEVHRVMGRGHRERFLQQALAIEFGLRRIPFEQEVPCPVFYKNQRLVGTARLDLVCFGSVVVEVKSRPALTPADAAQLIGYLASSGHHCGLLLNFGGRRLEYRRLVGPGYGGAVLPSP